MSTINFSPSLSFRLDHIQNQYERNKKPLKDLYYILNDRAVTEQIYSKSLEGVSQNLLKICSEQVLDPEMSKIIMSLRSSILTHSEQGQ